MLLMLRISEILRGSNTFNAISEILRDNNTLNAISKILLGF